MSEKTNIQWCDSTVNPVMGCDGCPLLPAPKHVANMIAHKLVDYGYAFEQSLRLLKEKFEKMPLTEIYMRRMKIAALTALTLENAGSMSPREAASFISREIDAALKCYAARLHVHRGADPTISDRKPVNGYAAVFEKVTLFPDRMKKAAKLPNLSGHARPERRWLDGLPRLIFVSDMGDALSNGVKFKYLKEEIIDNVVSDRGKQHVWLWLTKRPERMAGFDRWLAKHGIEWPDNLIPMTTIIDQDMVNKARKLLQVRARAHGLSIEPLWERLDIELSGWSWVIVGGESGEHSEPFHLEWARELLQQCRQKDVAFFMKQIGENPYEGGVSFPATHHKHGGNWNEWPEDLRVREFPKSFRTMP
ncbi:DUF5131 family protein [Luteolibacter sp. LG18]|uniref:DUF5131 family protein n=1 Tax=Luteolibacter sp. LG18 TaxID=2819286 RepID=UPI002B2DE599|nr:hypothetical protein llg_15790 [Luteolibacter sp. LG18]